MIITAIITAILILIMITVIGSKTPASKKKKDVED